MSVKKILQIGDPKLKKETDVISDFKSPRLKRLIQDLSDTMHKTGLIGIAAPQIGRNEKIFVTHPRSTQYRKKTSFDILRIFINPVVTYRSKEKVILYEGCGCVGTTVDVSIFGPVLRSREIEVEARDEKGNKFRLRSDGILARVIQHEMDHLNGIEFIEKVDDYKKLLSREFYVKKIKNSQETKLLTKITKREYESL